MYLVVFQRGSNERRWIGSPSPRRGVVRIGAAIESDVQLVGHNIAAEHVRLHFESKGRVRIEVRHAHHVRLDDRPPSADALLTGESVLEIGPWCMRIEPSASNGIDPIDETFLGSLDTSDARLVYADSLEERGRLAEAELVRACALPETRDVHALAERTPPIWRQRFLPMVVEGCSREDCRRTVVESGPCTACGRHITVFAHLASAREHARRGNPVAIDPAVRRWPNDLREPVVRRPAIDMGRPTGFKPAS